MDIIKEIIAVSLQLPIFFCATHSLEQILEPGIVWIGRNLKNHPAPALAIGMNTFN